ncbi:MAG: hypothetical protein J7K85_01670 [Anaerolineaceae bacterium]|nr:hypothetical protein [Anaerolineaceae bacterium]
MSHIIALNHRPETLLTYRQLHAKLQTSPEGAVLNFLLALHLYRLKSVSGLSALTLAVHSLRLQPGKEGFENLQLSRNDQVSIATQLKLSPAIPDAYILGCGPENQYRIPPSPFRTRFSIPKLSGDPLTGTIRIAITCSGAATQREVLCRIEKTRFWRVDEWSALMIPVKTP